MTAEVLAPAKINLTLHVTGRRADGYHQLDSLAAFTDFGDTISAAPASRLTLSVDGPQSAGLETGEDNLVLRAARSFGTKRGAALRLTKRLPVASGIGGGSSDAAATLLALSDLWGCPLPPHDVVLGLGSDVPVCLRRRAARMRGVGERIEHVPPLPPIEVLLVNPGRPVATPDAFRALAQPDNPPMGDIPAFSDAAALGDWLAHQRNDLLDATRQLCPEVDAALAAIRATGALFAGMSGSGATCFGLYPPGKAPGLEIVRREGWWAAAGRLS